MANFIFDDGALSESWPTISALRILVSMSAIGSELFIILITNLPYERREYRHPAPWGENIFGKVQSDGGMLSVCRIYSIGYDAVLRT